jgi:hypothetical protein
LLKTFTIGAQRAALGCRQHGARLRKYWLGEHQLAQPLDHARGVEPAALVQEPRGEVSDGRAMNVQIAEVGEQALCRVDLGSIESLFDFE